MTDPITPAAGADVQGDPAALGDPGKKALDVERAGRSAAETLAAGLQAKVDALEAEKLSELEQAQLAAKNSATRVAALEADIVARDLLIVKQRVGVELKLPAALIDRLQGGDEAAILEDGKALAALMPAGGGTPRPKPDPFQGGDGSGLHSSIDSADREFVGQLFQKD